MMRYELMETQTWRMRNYKLWGRRIRDFFTPTVIRMSTLRLRGYSQLCLYNNFECCTNERTSVKQTQTWFVKNILS